MRHLPAGRLTVGAVWIFTLVCVAGFVASTLIFWFRFARRNLLVLFITSIIVNIGMWFERYVIIVTSLAQDFLPTNWRYFAPTVWDIGTFVGSLGLFFTLFMLFARFVPVVAISEVKSVLKTPVGEPALLEESRA